MSANPATRYQRGSHRERQVRDLLREQGWEVFRCAGSKPCDLVALRIGVNGTLTATTGTLRDMELTVPAGVYARTAARLIEVKAGDHGGPFENFRPADRQALSEAAQRAGAEAWLVWWPPRREPQWIAEPDWPGAP